MRLLLVERVEASENGTFLEDSRTMIISRRIIPRKHHKQIRASLLHRELPCSTKLRPDNHHMIILGSDCIRFAIIFSARATMGVANVTPNGPASCGQKDVMALPVRKNSLILAKPQALLTAAEVCYEQWSV